MKDPGERPRRWGIQVPMVHPAIALGFLVVATACAAPGPGVPVEELWQLEELLCDPGWTAREASHDDSARYRLPYDPSTPRLLAQGQGRVQGPAPPVLAVPGLRPGGLPVQPRQVGGSSHRGRYRHAFDFVLPVGEEVRAARPGSVLCVGADTVAVRHADDTVGLYLHLGELGVSAGQWVEASQVVGRAGSPGGIPHLHFSVVRIGPSGRIESLPIRFDDGSAAGFVPVQGQYYGEPGR